MALLVGQLVAQLDMDIAPYLAKSARMTAEGRKLVKQLSEKIVLDADSKPLEQANEKAKAALKDLHTQAGKTGAGLQSELGDALRTVQADIKELAPASKKAGQEVGDNLGD